MSDSVPNADTPAPAREMKGRHVVLYLLLPPALIVGLGFVLLAPAITAKKPGHLYIGLRFADEASVEFIDKNVANPLTRLDIYAGFQPPGDTVPVASFPDLRRGKNIVDTRNFEDGLYQLVFTSPGYEPVILVAEVMEGEFVKTSMAIVPENGKVMDQFIGIVFDELEQRP